MASFNSAVPQFTNQLAYQSVFSPPGFSFETPFGYPPSTSNANSTGGANENAMQQQQHQHQQHREDYRMGMDDGMNGLVAGSTEAESSASGSMQVAGDMWKSAWPMPMSGGKVESPSLHALFPSPSIRLNTGDRFSQLLEEKLGMDQRITSTAFQSQTNTAPSSAPAQLISHTIPQPLPYSVMHMSPGQTQQASYPSFASAAPSGQSWDQMAIESNLQDYNQVQIQPDLVAPIPPASYFHMGGVSGTDYVGGLSIPVASGSRGPLSQQALYASHTSAESYTNPMSAPPFPTVQASPHSMSARSSPSNHASQLGTPHIMQQSIPTSGDLRWTSTTPFTPLPPPSTSLPSSSAISLPRHAQSQPLLRHPSADTTAYLPFQRIRHDAQSIPPPLSPANLGTATTVPVPPMGLPSSHSQSYPGDNGAWARDMVTASPSSQSQSSMPISASLQHFPTYSQPLSRSTSQQAWASAPPPASEHYPLSNHPLARADGIPSSFPPAPQLSKRSRSPQSQNTSPSRAPLFDSKDGVEGKRPKLSVPMNISSSSHMIRAGSQSHSDEDGEKKIIIACHTCRARKLKCDGARPKCHHCSRRNEDACVYDAVLRRRGPGKKTKKGGKGDANAGRESHSPSAEMLSASAPNRQYGSRFEISTERS